MSGIFYGDLFITVAGVLTCSIIATGIIHAWERHKLRTDGRRAVVRLKTFLHGTQLEPAEVEALIQDILEKEERINKKQAVDPALSLQVGNEIPKTYDSNSPELDDVDALVREILDDREPLNTELASSAGPTIFGGSLEAVRDNKKQREQMSVRDLPLKAVLGI